MGIVVEDGTGLSNSNSLCSVAVADTYFADRGVTTWTGANGVKETALIRATDFVETRWGRLFQGVKATSTQALSFPRLYIDEDGVVPVRVQYAVAEYALRALAGTPLIADPTVDATGRATKRVKEALEGAVSSEVEYFGSSPQMVSYPAADLLLSDYVRSANRSYR